MCIPPRIRECPLSVCLSVPGCRPDGWTQSSPNLFGLLSFNGDVYSGVKEIGNPPPLRGVYFYIKFVQKKASNHFL